MLSNSQAGMLNLERCSHLFMILKCTQQSTSCLILWNVHEGDIPMNPMLHNCHSLPKWSYAIQPLLSLARVNVCKTPRNPFRLCGIRSGAALHCVLNFRVHDPRIFYNIGLRLMNNLSGLISISVIWSPFLARAIVRNDFPLLGSQISVPLWSSQIFQLNLTLSTNPKW